MPAFGCARPEPCRTSVINATRPGWDHGVRGGVSHGYADGLLVEGTRILAAQDVPRIRAGSLKCPNGAGFQRAGYVNFERSINMTWR